MNARARRRSPRHARRLAGSAGVSVLLAAGALSACGSTAPTATDPGGPAASSIPASPSDAGSGASGASGAPSSSGPVATGSPIEASPSAVHQVMVPVYFVTKTPRGPRLVQELHSVDAANPVLGAERALEAAPNDPDYTSYYHSGDLGDAHFDGRSFTAVLTNTALAKRGTLSVADAKIAVQQLVYTLAAAQSAPGAPTRVITGGATTPLFGIATSHGVTPADQLVTLADINVLRPAEGSRQSGTLRARGLANSPEANVPWKITDAHGKVVKHGAATATGWMDKLYPWSTKIDISGLPAGRYTFSASTENQADSSEAAAPSVDTKTFTIS